MHWETLIAEQSIYVSAAFNQNLMIYTRNRDVHLQLSNSSGSFWRGVKGFCFSANIRVFHQLFYFIFLLL